MSKNIVILSGSPRKSGSTERLVVEFIAGAKNADKNVTEFRVADMKIAACRGCGHCFANGGECVHKDDMPQIIEAMYQADAIVFASPVYYWNVTAQLKTAIDRFYSTLHKPTPIKTAALIMTCGNGADDAFDASVATYKRILKHQNWGDGGIVTANSLHAPEQLNGHAALQQARELGQSI
jgi:multimeric flavodoxin WrbA